MPPHSDLKIVFPHIAKTGGTALLYHFRRNLGDERMFVYGPHSRCTRFFAGLPQLEELSLEERGRCGVVQGHGVDEQTLGLLNDPSFKLMVVLRSPVPLTRSRFNQRFIGNKRRGKGIDAEKFMQNSASNIIAKRMIDLFPSFVDPDARSHAEEAISVLRKFDYVYTTEQLAAQAAPMMRVHGLPETIEHRRVAGEEKLELNVSDEQIMSQNAVDQEVFETFNHVVGGDGSSHNAAGLDSKGRATVLKRIKAPAANADGLRRFCYDELARAMCRDLQVEAALAKIELDPGSVAIADIAAFQTILTRAWQQHQPTLTADAQEKSGIRARKLIRRTKRNQSGKGKNT